MPEEVVFLAVLGIIGSSVLLFPLVRALAERSWPSAWISRNGCCRSRARSNDEPGHDRRVHPDYRRGRFLRLDDLAFPARESPRGAPAAWPGAPRGNRRRSDGVGRKRRGVASGGGGTGGASRFYRTAARPTEGGRAVSKAAVVMLPAETGRGQAA